MSGRGMSRSLRPRTQTAAPRAWLRGDHAELAPDPAWQVKPCRVCRAPVAIGASYFRRAWSTEIAHAACGWLLEDERAPHECSGAELRTRLFQWACTSCGRDVVRRAMPDAGADLRCRACLEAST